MAQDTRSTSIVPGVEYIPGYLIFTEKPSEEKLVEAQRAFEKYQKTPRKYSETVFIGKNNFDKFLLRNQFEIFWLIAGMSIGLALASLIFTICILSGMG